MGVDKKIKNKPRQTTSKGLAGRSDASVACAGTFFVLDYIYCALLPVYLSVGLHPNLVYLVCRSSS